MRKAVRAIIVKDNNILLMHRHKFGHEYYALPGGGIDIGETPEQALYREIMEEASIEIANLQLVIDEDAGPIYGQQLIYACDYVSGYPKLAATSEEAQITALGQNLYLPEWFPIAQLSDINLLPGQLKTLLIERLSGTWDETPIKLTINQVDKL
jgi:8-oxo-dGTP pyrophosphatase MutT (NUDIX family)